jgi:hypothetical protein
MNIEFIEVDPKNKHQRPLIPIPIKTKTSRSAFTGSSQRLLSQLLHLFDDFKDSVFQRLHRDTSCEHAGQ